MISSVSSSGYFPNFRNRSDANAKTSALDPKPEAKDAQETGKDGLTDTEKEQVKKLKERDAHVRSHEMAHLAAAGSLARGGPRFEYQTGPDGKNYAVGGEVSIDTSPGRTPEETAQKAGRMKAAALTASDPSPQDLHVAATAGALASEAEKQKQNDAEPESISSSKRSEIVSITSSRQLLPASDTQKDDPTKVPKIPDLSSGKHRGGLTAMAARLYQKIA